MLAVYRISLPAVAGIHPAIFVKCSKIWLWQNFCPNCLIWPDLVNFSIDATSITSSQQASFNRLSLCWSSPSWTTAMVRWLVCQHIQSVQNAAARLCHYDHITDVLVSLHWLRVPESIVFKVAVQTNWVLQGDAPQYLRQFTSVADTPSRQRLRSSSSDHLLVPAVRLSILLDVAPSRCSHLERFTFGRYLLTVNVYI